MDDIENKSVKSFEYIKDKNGEIACINVETENSIYEFKKDELYSLYA